MGARKVSPSFLFAGIHISRAAVITASFLSTLKASALRESCIALMICQLPPQRGGSHNSLDPQRDSCCRNLSLTLFRGKNKPRTLPTALYVVQQVPATLRLSSLA